MALALRASMSLAVWENTAIWLINDHSSGSALALWASTALALQASMALVLRGSTALALQALHSFAPTLQSTAGFSQSPKSTKHFT